MALYEIIDRNASICSFVIFYLMVGALSLKRPSAAQGGVLLRGLPLKQAPHCYCSVVGP